MMDLQGDAKSTVSALIILLHLQQIQATTCKEKGTSPFQEEQSQQTLDRKVLQLPID